MEKFNKSFVAIRYWLLGRKYHMALKALEYGYKFHLGKRKDGTTPEYFHQLSIAHFMRTFDSQLMYPEETLATIFLHDVCEDADVGFEEINAIFGQRVTTSVRYLTKKHRGTKIALNVYYDGIAEDAIASVGKGGDRIDNQGSMVGVFDFPKQKQYIEETETLILPMLKKARRRFTEQETVYENLKSFLNGQINLIRAIHAASEYQSSLSK